MYPCILQNLIWFLYYHCSCWVLRSCALIPFFPFPFPLLSFTAETIENGSYAPFSRPLFIYVNKESINKPQVEQFVDFYIAKAADFSKEVGYVALPNSVYEAGLENFISENVGTNYLTAEMEKRSGPVTEVYSKDNLVK